jgi:hypothetical protein
MWTLLKKNLWTWYPSRSANWVLLAAALAFSLADSVWHFSAAGWLLPCCIALLLAQAAGTSAFDVDLKRDNMLFLEYLPIRWWEVWLSNWIEQVLAVTAVLVLLCWWRLASWAPVAPEDAWRQWLFESRWLLPVSLATGSFFIFSYALQWRTFFKSDKAALLPMYLGSMLYIAIPMMIPAILLLRPGLRDLWPLLIVQGVVFSAGSFVAFVLPPLYWTRSRRFLVMGLPILLTSFVVELALMGFACTRWQHLDWRETGLRVSVDPRAGTRPGDWLAVNVQSARSGTHQLACNPQDGRITYLGRNLWLHSAFDATDRNAVTGVGAP